MSRPPGVYPEHRPLPQSGDQSRGRHPLANHRHTTGPTYDNTAPGQLDPLHPSLPTSLVPGSRPRAKSSASTRNMFFEPRSAPPPLPPLPILNHPQIQLQQSPTLMTAPPMPPSLPEYPFPPQPVRQRAVSHRSQSVPTPPALPPKQFDIPAVPPLPPKIPLYPDFIHSHPLTPQSPPKFLSNPAAEPRNPLPVPPSPPPKPPQFHGVPLGQHPPPGPSPPSPAARSVYPSKSVSSPPHVSSSLPSDEDAELERVLALSAQECQQQQRKLSMQEDEDLARAMRESLLPSESFHPDLPVPTIDDDTVNTGVNAYSSNSPQQVTSDLQNMPSFPVPVFSPSPSADGSWRMPSPSRVDSTPQMADDESLARRLAKEDGVPREPQPQLAEPEPQPPLYHQVVANELTVPIVSSTCDVGSRPGSSMGRSSSASAVVPGPRPSSVARPHSFVATSTQTLSASASENSFRSSSSPSLPHNDEHSPPVVGAPTAKSFVDPSLLNGISFGFTPPQISAVSTMMRGSIPNVISLPAGKCPPFHVQAPNWRQLLKLMARLSWTRIEPSLEAMVDSKSDFKLRTVVQFVKVHHSLPDWRTILYLTVDSSPPANTSASNGKNTNGDVNTLPWSYTQIQMPVYLHDGADGPLSKFYTIPSTTTTPYPILPISFPNMAIYLASAMEDSRRTTNDSSSGMRKLSKMVDTFYPNQNAPGAMEDPEEVKGTVGRAIRNMFGRNGKQPSRRNEDTWDLVTPFVADDDY